MANSPAAIRATPERALSNTHGSGTISRCNQCRLLGTSQTSYRVRFLIAIGSQPTSHSSCAVTEIPGGGGSAIDRVKKEPGGQFVFARGLMPPRRLMAR